MYYKEMHNDWLPEVRPASTSSELVFDLILLVLFGLTLVLTATTLQNNATRHPAQYTSGGHAVPAS